MSGRAGMQRDTNLAVLCVRPERTLQCVVSKCDKRGHLERAASSPRQRARCLPVTACSSGGALCVELQGCG